MRKLVKTVGAQAVVFSVVFLATMYTQYWADYQYASNNGRDPMWLSAVFSVLPLVLSLAVLARQWLVQRSVKALLPGQWMLRAGLGVVLAAGLSAMLWTGLDNSILYLLIILLACVVSFLALEFSVLPMFGLAGLAAVVYGRSSLWYHYDWLSRVAAAGFVMALLSLALWLVFKKRFAVAKTVGQWVGFGTVAALGAFLYCYNAVVVSPNEVLLQSKNVIFVLFSWVFSTALGLVALFGLSSFSGWLARRTASPLAAQKGSLFLRWGGLLLVMGAVWLVWWAAFCPGNMSADSLDQWRQATGQGPLYNSHPYMGTLWIGIFANLWPTPALYTLVQVLLLACLYATLLLWWYKKGLPFWLCMSLAAVIALLPTMGLYATIVWKDIPFCMALLWLAFLFARLALGEKPGVGFACEIALALLVVATFRHNGILVSLLCVAAFVVMAFRVKAKALLAGVITGLVLYLFVAGPLAGVLKVNKYEMGMSGLAVSTVGAAIFYDVDMPPDIEEEALQYASREEWVESYNPYHYFGYFNAGPPSENPFIRPYYQKSALQVAELWFRLFLKAPLVMFNERMAMCDSVLFVNQGVHENAYNTPYWLGIAENDFGLAQTPSALNSVLQSLVFFSSENTALNSLFWRNGIWWMLCFWLLYYNFWKKQGPRNLYLLPMGANVLSLLVAVTEQGYRYTHVIIPYTLVGMVLTVFPAFPAIKAAKATAEATKSKSN